MKITLIRGVTTGQDGAYLAVEDDEVYSVKRRAS